MIMRCAILSVFCGVLLLACPEITESQTTTENEAPIVVYYFHRRVRCQTCLTIENLAHYEVTMDLAEEIEAGRLVWRLVNVDEPENAHFNDDFELMGPSLIVVEYAHGTVVRWKLLGQVWDLYDDLSAFDAYVLGSVEEFMNSESADLTIPEEMPTPD